MANLTPAVINYRMFENTTDFLGITQITLPKLEMMTQEVKGAGIAGAVTVALGAQMQSMQIQIQMMTKTEQTIQLAEQKVHTWEFRVAQEYIDQRSGEHHVTKVKHVIRAFPNAIDGETLQPQSSSNPTVTAQVYYWAEYRNGEKVLEVDPLNYICFINGTDCAKEVREALGLGE